VNVTETNRSEEYIGVEQRVIDNTRSGSPSNRKLFVSKEWTKSYVVEQENARKIEGKAEVSVKILANISASIENAITAKYSIASQTRQLHSEEIDITIPSKTRIRLYLQWKRIWQHGFVRLRNRRHVEIEVPFKVVSELTFDQVQVDEI